MPVDVSDWSYRGAWGKKKFKKKQEQLLKQDKPETIRAALPEHKYIDKPLISSSARFTALMNNQRTISQGELKGVEVNSSHSELT